MSDNNKADLLAEGMRLLRSSIGPEFRAHLEAMSEEEYTRLLWLVMVKGTLGSAKDAAAIIIFLAQLISFKVVLPSTEGIDEILQDILAKSADMNEQP